MSTPASQHVEINIVADSIAVARASFGVLACLSHNASFAERAKLYGSLSEVTDDGFAADSPEAKCASRWFAGGGRKFMILRATGTLTQSYDLTIDSAVVGEVYQATAVGEGFAETTVSYTALGGDTTDDIATGLAAALNGVTNKTYTATATLSSIAIVADAANDWFSVSLSPLAHRDGLMSIAQDHAAPVDVTLATDLAAITDADSSWFWLETLYNSEAYVLAVAAAIPAYGFKLYLPQTSASADLGASTGTAGPLDKLAAAPTYKAAGFYHHNPASFLTTGLAADLATREVGSWTAKFKRVDGVAVSPLSGSQRANLVARHANFYESVRGIPMVAEGTTSIGPSLIRGFIDDVVNLDWLKDDMEARILEIKAGTGKVPRTNEGMVQLEAGARATLEGAVTRAILKANPEPVVDVPLIEDMDDLLPRGVRMSAGGELAGAVHKSTVTVNVEL